MSLYDYEASQRIAARDDPFYALIMAAMRKADTDNTEKLRTAYPEVYDELNRRYRAMGGCITPEEIAALEAELAR